MKGCARKIMLDGHFLAREHQKRCFVWRLLSQAGESKAARLDNAISEGGGDSGYRFLLFCLSIPSSLLALRHCQTDRVHLSLPVTASRQLRNQNLQSTACQTGSRRLRTIRRRVH